MNVSKKDEAFRQYALEAHPLRLIMIVCGPLAVYMALQQIFKLLDALMAAHIGSDAVSAVSVLSQITLMITALGSGLAVGGSIKISEAYGQGDYDLVRRRTSTLYALVIILSAIICAVLIPFAVPFLRLLQTPEDLISKGTGYFRVEILSLVVGFFNTVYIAIERSRGHSRMIMLINVAVIVLKLLLSALFIYLLDQGVMMIAVATLISQLALTAFAVIRMLTDEGAFRVSAGSISFGGETAAPMLKISGPVVAEKLLFQSGKVIVNSMAGVYGALTAGALGMSNNIGGLTTNWHAGFQDGASALISQNRGAGKYSRTLGLFWWLTLVNVLIGLAGYIIVSFCLPWLAEIFARSKNSLDLGFRDMIVDIHRWEMIGYITLGLSCSVNALLLGYGWAKTVTVLNVVRVFVFRIPVLWYLQTYTDVGHEAVGITMMVSNVSAGLLSALAAVPLILKIKKLSEKE